MELIFRVGSIKILNNTGSGAFNSTGLDEKQSKERPYFVVEKYYVSIFSSFLKLNTAR